MNEVEDYVVLNGKDIWLMQQSLKFMEWGIEHDYSVSEPELNESLMLRQISILKLKLHNVEQNMKKQAELEGNG